MSLYEQKRMEFDTSETIRKKIPNFILEELKTIYSLKNIYIGFDSFRYNSIWYYIPPEMTKTNNWRRTKKAANHALFKLGILEIYTASTHTDKSRNETLLRLSPVRENTTVKEIETAMSLKRNGELFL